MEALFICYPKCSTCAKARKFLQEKGIPFQERNIKEENPTQEELAQWICQSGLPAEKFFNTSGMLYREKNLKAVLPGLTQQEKIRLLAEDGMLVKRPLLIGEGFVLAGFRQGQWEEAIPSLFHLLAAEASLFPISHGDKPFTRLLKRCGRQLRPAGLFPADQGSFITGTDPHAYAAYSPAANMLVLALHMLAAFFRIEKQLPRHTRDPFRAENRAAGTGIHTFAAAAAERGWKRVFRRKGAVGE